MIGPSPRGSAEPDLRELFARASALPPGERGAYLDAACAGRPDLRQRVEGMLALLARDDDATVTRAPAAGDEAAGIGPYKVLQLIGEGGFGSVFAAEQQHPVRRTVAIKVLKAGMDTRQVVARFEQERQALALMDHPNIAKVLDAGATAQGRPYFVMELVRGVPITEYCDQHLLSMRERLELFVPVCQAIQHAHQKGIIHRDIKPSNILVALLDGKPVPKVIDFGIAKATGARLTELTLQTEYRQLIGTPAYMSPEQAAMTGLDIDTRADVYSLGVLLYELLTGTTPFDSEALRAAGYGEIQRLIREVEPQKPSTRVSSLDDTSSRLAAQRRTEPRKLGALIRGELDWIVMKALEKDRTRRYESAGALAADVQRHLAGAPVEAAPPSRAYLVKKLLRRHRGAVLAAAAVALALALGIVGTTVGLVRERSAREREGAALAAETQQRRRAEATTSFLQEMLRSADPETAHGQKLTVEDLLDRAAERIGESLTQDPEVEATLRQTIGQTYNQLSRYRDAKEQCSRAYELRRRTLGPEHRDTLAARLGVAVATLQLGDVEEARGDLEELVRTLSRVSGRDHADTLTSKSLLAFATQLAGDDERALVLMSEVLPQQIAQLGPADERTLETMASMADIQKTLGRFEDAERAAREMIATASAAHGPESVKALEGESILASILNDAGRYAEAEEVGRHALDARTRIYGLEHRMTLLTANTLAISLENQDRFEEAIAILRPALDAAVRALGAEHGTTLSLQNRLARVLQLHGDLDAAEPLFRRTLEARRRASPDDIATLGVMNDLGLLLLARKKSAEAEEVLRPMLAGVERSVPEGHWLRGQAMVNLGRSLAEQHRFSEAEKLLLAGYDVLASAFDEGHQRRTIAAGVIADMYARWEKGELAEQWRARR
jgi:serine/threonine protein kinase